MRVSRAYLKALQAGDDSRAYRLLSAEARVHFQKSPPEPKGGGEPPWRSPYEVSFGARMPSEAGEILLEKTARGWVLTSGVLDFYSQESPREALRAFVLAVEQRRYDVLYELAPLRFQKEMTISSLEEEMEKDRPEILRKVEQLKAHLHEPIRVLDKTAVLFYPEGGVELLYEEGRWRVFHLK